MKLQSSINKRAKLARRFSTALRSETPLRQLAGDFSRFAKYALAEANSLAIENIVVKIRRLPKQMNGFRLVHLSDFHHSPFTGLEHVLQTVKIANRQKPDMVVLTGDYVSHESKYIPPVAEALGLLESKFGTFACLGNHDHWTNPELLTDAFRSAGITVLINQGIRFTANGSAFWLCGVDDYMVGKTDLRAALRGSFPDEMKLLLAHNPVIVRQAARSGVDLVLSGHTHGGQVKLRVQDRRILRPRKLVNGLHRRRDTQIYITRGIGTVVLPIRFGCPPEISVIELSSN